MGRVVCTSHEMPVTMVKMSFSFKRNNSALFVNGISSILIPMLFQIRARKMKAAGNETISERHLCFSIAFGFSEIQTNNKIDSLLSEHRTELCWHCTT